MELIADMQDNLPGEVTLECSFLEEDPGSDGITSLSWSPSGQYIAASTYDGSIILYDWWQKKQLKTIESPGKIRINCENLVFTADSRYLVAISEDKNIYAISMDPKGERKRVSCGRAETEYFDISINPWQGSKRLVTTTYNGDAELFEYDTINGLCLRKINYTGLEGVRVFATSVSSQGDVAFLSYDNKVYVRSDSGNLETLIGHQGGVSSGDFSRSGNRLVTGAKDQIVRVWNKDTKTGVWKSGPVIELTYNINGIRFLNGSTESLAVVYSWDAVVFIVDVEKGEVLTLWAEDSGLDGYGAVSHPTEMLVAVKYGNNMRSINVYRINPGHQNRNPSGLKHKIEKVVLCGNSGAGKSTLSLRMRNRSFYDLDTTHGRNVRSITRQVQGEIREIVLCDLAGQEFYRPLQMIHLDGVKVVLVTFSLQHNSIEEAKYWGKLVRMINREAKLIFVGTKADLLHTDLDANRIQDKLKWIFDEAVEFFALSNTEGENQVFNQVVKTIFDSFDWEKSLAQPYVLIERVYLRVLQIGKDKEWLNRKKIRSTKQLPEAEIEAALIHLDQGGKMVYRQTSELVLPNPEVVDSTIGSIVKVGKKLAGNLRGFTKSDLKEFNDELQGPVENSLYLDYVFDLLKRSNLLVTVEALPGREPKHHILYEIERKNDVDKKNIVGIVLLTGWYVNIFAWLQRHIIEQYEDGKNRGKGVVQSYSDMYCNHVAFRLNGRDWRVLLDDESDNRQVVVYVMKLSVGYDGVDDVLAFIETWRESVDRQMKPKAYGRSEEDDHIEILPLPVCPGCKNEYAISALRPLRGGKPGFVQCIICEKVVIYPYPVRSLLP